ncbi:MAG: hypothetical protein LBP87_00850 [Planctomycetaceae bacterium]|jgi:hypothetical protein|nr:hypothetical protein [Planctomycetaceae bacterium]
MLQSRLNAFETNSSSIHTFCIKEGFKPDTNENSVLSATLQQYGWEHSSYTSSWFIDYCWTAILDYYNVLKYADDIETAKQKIKEYQDKIEAILKPCNIEVKWFYETEDGDRYYVDHADKFLPILDELLDNPELFISACLCEESCFYTANDNEDFYTPEKQEGFRIYVKRN